MKKQSKNLILLRTLLLSTSLHNIGKYSKDPKKKKKVIGNYIGLTVLYAMLIGYSAVVSVGLGAAGFGEAIPLMGALIICGMSFVFTVLRTNGYLFNFKEYDMLMALPFEVRDVAACKFLYMYVKSLPWYISIAFAMMIGYGIFERPNVLLYPVWLLLSLFLPIIPMLLAAFVGFVIAKLSSGFEKKNILQTVLTLIFVIFCFSLQFIIDAVFKNNEPMDVAMKTADITKSIGTYYFPAIWYSNAVLYLFQNPLKGLLFAAMFVFASLALFEIVFIPVSKYYRQINSAMKSHGAKRNFRMSTQKKSSVLNAIAFKEFKRFTGSTTYLVNAGMGHIMALILSVMVFVVGMDKLVLFITKGAPVPVEIIYPAIPFIIYFLVGMMSTTACSPSLEGKNYWIVQSLPIEKKTLYQGKMLFNMYLSVPVMEFGVIAFCIAGKVSPILMVLHLILGFLLCCFSTVWGCACGLKHIRLDWENEVEVIKQGTAVVIYMLPNMFVCMGLVVLVCFLGTKVNHYLIDGTAILIVALLTALSYARVMALTKKN